MGADCCCCNLKSMAATVHAAAAAVDTAIADADLQEHPVDAEAAVGQVFVRR